jgi:hypothetical protein
MKITHHITIVPPDNPARRADIVCTDTATGMQTHYESWQTMINRIVRGSDPVFLSISTAQKLELPKLPRLNFNEVNR